MTHMNRRHFLGTATAGAALAGAVTGKIRVGILCIQHSHLRDKLKAMTNNSDYELVSVCEPDEATKRSKGDNPLLQRLRWVSMEELLGDKSINLIVLEGEVKDRAIRGSVSWKQASTSIWKSPRPASWNHFRNW